MTRRAGPFEDGDWPDRVVAHAVAWDPAPRLHGYAVDDDVAVRYSWAELILLALTGELPDEAAGAAFDVALQFACPQSVNEAPVHAAVVSRNVGAPLASAVASGVVVAGQAARALVARHEPMLAWLADGATGMPPAAVRSDSVDDDRGVAALDACLDSRGAGAYRVASPLSREAAVTAVMVACGLRNADQLVAAWMLSRAVAIAAEACATRRGGMTSYAANVPPHRYEPA